MSKRLMVAAGVISALVFFISQGAAQTSTGRIAGVITDETGGVLPAVQVTVRNTATGAARNFASDEKGRYAAPELVPGPYEITATMTGFGTVVRQGITLSVGQEATINLTMKVGTVNEQVTAIGEAPLVNTTTSGVSSVIEERRITEMPLNGRDFSQLALVQPGALSVRTAAASDASKGFGTRISMSGSRPMETGWLLDGTNVNSVGNFGTPGSASDIVMGGGRSP